MTHIADSLEKALQLWEDNCLIVNLLCRAENKLGKKNSFPLHGPFVHFAEFRQYIIQSFNNFDSADFCRKFIEQRKPDKTSLLGDLAELPFELCLWSHASRRVYQLKTDIQLMLNATSINNVRWKDVRLPFESFAVMLDEPIIGKTAQQSYDCILVSSCFAYDHQVIIFRLISSEIKNYQPLTQETKNYLEQLLKKGQVDKLFKKLVKYSQALPDKIYLPHFDLPLSPEISEAKVIDPIVELSKKFIQQQNEKGIPIQIPDEVVIMPDEGNTAVRLAVGLSLFLTTKQGSSPKSYTHRLSKKVKKQLATPQITEESEIFKITLGQTLTAEQKEFLKHGINHGQTYIQGVQFRNGTWCFPPNKKDDPGAEKIFWRRPVIANIHLIREGELPKGTQTTIKKS